MAELTGKIADCNIDFVSGIPRLIIEVNEKNELFKILDELKNKEKLSIILKPYSKKRSLNINSYCWVLCTKLADKLSGEKVKYTKEEIYRKAIKEVGIYKDFENLTPSEAQTLRYAWELLGTGWLTEQVDYMPDGNNVIVRCYYGSSRYNQKQMRRLVQGIVEDCKAVGIQTETPEEIARMLSLWKGEI